MKAVILAAGNGTRMAPLTDTRPKCLIKVAGRSLLEWNLDTLVKAKVSEAILIVSDEKVQAEMGKAYRKMRLTYILQPRALGTGHAVLLAKKHVKAPFLALNGDNLADWKGISSVLKLHKSKKANILSVMEKQDVTKLSSVVFDRNGKVSRIIEKPKAPPSNFASLGIYLFKPEIFDMLRKVKSSPRGEIELPDAIQMLAEKGKVYACRLGFWEHLTYPWDVLSINKILMERIAPKRLGKVEKGATLKGKVHIGRGTLIKSGAYIEGPVYISEDCTIGPNCFVRAHTYLGKGVRVGNGVEIKNSVIGDETFISHLTYVGDSVVGSSCNFGAGTVCANLRFDNNSCRAMVKGEMVDTGLRKLGLIMGDNSQTGIDSVINPGRKIGSNCCVGPAVQVVRDVPSNTSVYIKQELETR